MEENIDKSVYKISKKLFDGYLSFYYTEQALSKDVAVPIS